MSSGNLIAIFLGLCALSSLFSALEIALFAVPRARARRLAAEPGAVGDVFRRLLEAPHAVLVQILLGNNLANIAATAVAAVLLDRGLRRLHMSEPVAIGIETVVLTAFLLVVCEITPKTFAFEKNEQVAPWFARIYALLRPALEPVARVLEGVAGFGARLMKGGPPAPLTADELETLVEVGAREGTLNPEESRLFRGAFRFAERTAGEILVPRADLTLLPADTTIAQAIDTVSAVRRVRVPLYDGTIDHIVGVLYAKDLLQWTLEPPGDRTVRSIMRLPYVAAPETDLETLLRAFQRERVHLAVVADVQGKALGIVTLEDVVEEIVGDIEDELEEEEPAYRPLGPNEGVFLGTVAVSEANRLLGTALPGTAGETLAALCARLLPATPTEGESHAVDGARLTVEAVTGRRVWSLRIARVREPAPAAPAAPAAPESGAAS
jgi:CBS domain containing-hemolysin-like protein